MEKLFRASFFMLALQFLIGAILIGVTVIIHAFALDLIIKRMRKAEILLMKMTRRIWKAFTMTFVVLAIFCAHIVEIWIWAIVYIVIGACNTLEQALYFSITTFSTVGFGDIYLDETWRMLSAIESANGFILFGWSTAFIFEIMSRLYKKESEDIHS